MRRVWPAALAALCASSSCGSAAGDLRPERSWREVRIEERRAYQSDSGPITVSVSDMELDADGIAKVRVWVYPREIETVSVEAADIVLVEPGGRLAKNDAGSHKQFATRSRPEPFVGIFQVRDLARLKREGCALRIPVVPYEPSEGPAIDVEVRFHPR